MTARELCWLIVGLGNPGRRYARHRHNVGFRCLDRLAARHGLTFDRVQHRALLALGSIADRAVVLAKPQTFMNESGRAVAPLVRAYQVPLERLLVVYDDLDLPPGTIRLRPEGGSGGHRGMRSIIEALGSQDFPRLRVGIGRPPGRMDPADYVLQDLSPEEEELFDQVCDRVAEAIHCWLTEGITLAMSRYNGPAIR
ncbi:MAG: aminoacyl-tRNA hydrolase [Chloroflexi bacterium]|nr:MAG: aminoacyl-tRNA hydrolase [Chloroflexota bacterium]